MRTGLFASIVFVLGTHAVLAEPPEVNIADARVVEGNSGDRAAELTVILSQPAPGPVTMTYSTRDGTAVAGTDYRPTGGTVAFAKGETTKKVIVMMIGDTTTEPDERLDVVLGGVSGVTLADGTGTVTIVNDDLAAAGRSTYEVRFTFRGFSGSMAGASGCPVRPDGTVVMTGLVEGNERVGRDEDITYLGVLQMDANLDLCDATTLPNGESMLCSIGVAGSGPMTVELDAHGDARDGYVKVEMVPGFFKKALWGSCDEALIKEEYDLFPDDSQATIFNGLDLPLRGPLRVGKYVQDDVVLDVLRVVRP